MTRIGLSFRGGSARLKEMLNWVALYVGLIAERLRGAFAPLSFSSPSPSQGEGDKGGEVDRGLQYIDAKLL